MIAFLLILIVLIMLLGGDAVLTLIGFCLRLAGWLLLGGIVLIAVAVVYNS